jgi:hypothetical protein
MGQYKGGKGNDRQFWLSAWSGKSHIVDRKNQDAMAISIPRPFINVMGGIPPEMLNELADQKGRNDGFFHRILFVYPRVLVGVGWSDITVSKASSQTWETTLARLRSLAMQELADGVLGYKAVSLSPMAKDAWVTWYNAHAAEMSDPNLPSHLLGPLGKLKSYAARLALVLHYLWVVQGDQPEGDLEAVSIERATRLVDYLKGHLRLVYGRLRQTPEDSRLLRALDWIRSHGGRCRARDLVRNVEIKPTPEAVKVMKELQDRGYGRLETQRGANHRGVEWFILDPS